MPHPPTDEQTHILSRVASGENIIINAFAGTGKTTTLEMIESESKVKPILYIAFGKSIAKEAETRMASTTTVRTANSLGHRIWAKSCGKNLRLDLKKSQVILREIINQVPRKDAEPFWDSFWSVVRGVGLAKAHGYVPDGKFLNAKHLINRTDFHATLEEDPDDLTADLIDAVLSRSITQAYDGLVDYNDQVYMPALFGGIYPQFPRVMADEAQDLNAVNHELLKRVVRDRFVAVGDPNQSIYGFRGAVQSGMSKLQEAHGLISCDLSTSFRCPSAIVEAARWRVPNFKWVKEGGHVENLKELDPSGIPDEAAIICRNNAPLFGVALHLLSSGRSVSVAGSDIGPKLIGLLRKLGPGELPRSSVISAIADWEEERLAKGSTTAEDMAACMRVFAETGTDLDQAIRYAEHVLGQQGSIRLMTGHKAKGLEFDTVYMLDPFLLRTDEQDLNLRYVMQTRSRDTLYEINSRDIKW